ncbi:hypothetical protein OKW39_004853 [Paraburkholderia sp. MM6662-R1]
MQAVSVGKGATENGGGSGSLGRNVGAITMDAIASTIGNTVVDQVQAGSVGKTDYTKQAIEALNGEILPGGLGGVGSGFVAPQTSYSSNAALFGVYGGLVDNTPASYSGAATLLGPSSGLGASQIDQRPGGLADRSGSSENLLYVWDRAKQYGADGWNPTKQFAHDMVGATSMDAARANWDAGNYGTAVTKCAQSFLEAGMTAFTLAAAPIKTGITALVNGGRAALASEMLGGGAPIFSSGGLLGSRMWASSVGTGEISAGITAGSKYYQKGAINPVDVGVSFGVGAIGTRYNLAVAGNMVLNAAGGVADTAINNVVYGKSDSLVNAGFTSAALSGLGYGLGKSVGSWFDATLKPTLGNSRNWASTDVWSGGGWNLFSLNTGGVIAGTIGGGVGQSAVGPLVPPFPYGSGQK